MIPTRTSRSDNEFSVIEFRTDPGAIFDYAAAHGSAIVRKEDGRVHALITIPTEDMPTLDAAR